MGLVSHHGTFVVGHLDLLCHVWGTPMILHQPDHAVSLSPRTTPKARSPHLLQQCREGGRRFTTQVGFQGWTVRPPLCMDITVYGHHSVTFGQKQLDPQQVDVLLG